MGLTREDLAHVAASVDETHGWDASPLRDERHSVPWTYREVVRRDRPPSHRVLETGTGGGETFLSEGN